MINLGQIGIVVADIIRFDFPAHHVFSAKPMAEINKSAAR
jgi:hypothetical protein